MPAETVVPCIRTRKRRLVPPDKRKKASFSCDRCKIRKIACHRSSPSLSCVGCERAGANCETTIKRKKKIRGPIENIGLHYKCLLALIQFSFPEIDVNNIDALIDVGERNGVSMPSRYGGKDGDNELRDLSLLITLGKLPATRSSSLDLGDLHIKTEENEDLAGESPVDHELQSASPQASSPVVKKAANTPKDVVITDQSGNRHVVGPQGTAAFVLSSIKTLSSTFDLDLSGHSSLQHAFEGELTISSTNEPVKAIHLSFFSQTNFPYLGEISIQEASYFTDCFFSNVHPRYPCLVESQFRSSLDMFWTNINMKSFDRPLSSHTICSIYMVWLLGRLFSPGVVQRVDHHMAQRYLLAVKMCLSDIILTPSLDGIRTLVLLAIYLEAVMKKESAYVVIEIAVRQAITLGLNKDLQTPGSNNKIMSEEVGRLWWVVYLLEVSSSCQMGRTSTILKSDATTAFPLLRDICGSADYLPTFFAILDLTKNMHDILDYRQVVNRSENMLSDENIERAVSIDNAISRTALQINPALLDLSIISDFKIHLLMRLHYAKISLVLPLLLKLARKPELAKKAKLQTLLTQGLNSCIAVVHLIEASMASRMFNGTVHSDTFYTFHGVMGLIIGHCLLSNAQISKAMNGRVQLEQLDQALGKIRRLSLSGSGMCSGTFHKLSIFIDAFIAAYDYVKGQLQERDSGLMTYGQVLNTPESSILEMFANTKNRIKAEEGTFDEYFMGHGPQDYSNVSAGLPAAEMPHFGNDVLGGGLPGYGNGGFGVPERFAPEGLLPGDC